VYVPAAFVIDVVQIAGAKSVRPKSAEKRVDVPTAKAGASDETKRSAGS
jgi:hypothetical protein